jgi:alkyl sulfatase BDS1-like metallo-beta-lactamase superfamily hydrolase
VVELLEKQRDLYRFINDETLRMANQGMTMREIAEQIELPESLATFWANRGYYGSLYHDVAATYVLYLGWFDGNPATLHELPPAAASRNYVEFMGGADAVLAKAKESFDNGDYRWVAQVVNHVVFADPENQEARNLQADALEQLGYQAENGPWRNFYLTGAKELREGVNELPTPNTASPDTVRAMSPEMFFDYLGVRLDSAKAGDATAKLNIDLGDSVGQYLLELENGVLNHTADVQADDADATVTLTRDTLNDIILQQTTLAEAISAGDVNVNGEQAKLEDLVSYLDSFEFWFNIATP